MAERNYGAIPSQGSRLDTMYQGDWLNIPGAKDFNGPNTQRGEIETTDLDCTSKTFIPDLKDNGSFTFNLNTMLGTKGQWVLYQRLDSYTPERYRLTLVDDGMGNGPVNIFFDATVASLPIQGAVGQAVTSNASLRITGDVVIDMPLDHSKRLVLGAFALSESTINDGSISGVISVVAHGVNFAGTDDDPLPGVTFAGVPSGLTAECIKINASTASIAFTGEADTHTEAEAAVTVTFGDASFSGAQAAEVHGAKNQPITIKFKE